MAEENYDFVPILEAIEDGIYVVNESLEVQFMNQAMVKEFGTGVGRKCYEVIGGLDDVCPWCEAEKVFRGESIRRELYLPRHEKTYYLIETRLRNADGTLSKLAIYRDITQARAHAEKLRVSEEDYRRLFEHVGCGVYISSKEGRFLDVNRALLEMLGYEDKDEFLKIDITKDLYLNPKDRKKFQALIERDGSVVDYEVNFKRKDGTSIPVLLTSHVRYDEQGRVLGYEGISVDQSHRRRMEKEVREVNDFLTKIIESSPNAIMATDLKGNIIIWNRAAEEILGYGAEEVVGKMNIEKIYPEDGMARNVMKMIRVPEHGGPGRLTSYPMVYAKQDGEVIDGNLSAALVYNSAGKAIASVGIFVDLRERLDMERTLRHTQEQLLQSEKLAAMGKLTSQIAHEVNNPLYGIMNTLELLKTEISPQSKRRRILEMALSETVRLAEMLRKMLSFSKPSEEERQPTDLNEILEEVLLLHAKQLQERGIRLFSELKQGLGTVHASKSQLRQVFLNMLSNARDAMPDGGDLSIETYEKGKYAYVMIRDTGVGISPENLKKVFEAFFTTKDSIKGVGLGLSVCYGFIRDHGGDIKVASTLNEGTTFTISLPLHHNSAGSK